MISVKELPKGLASVGGSGMTSSTLDRTILLIVKDHFPVTKEGIASALKQRGGHCPARCEGVCGFVTLLCPQPLWWKTRTCPPPCSAPHCSAATGIS